MARYCATRCWPKIHLGQKVSALVSEIVVEDKTASISGSYSALADAMLQIKTGSLKNQVPSFIPIWHPQGVLSKSRPSESPLPAKLFAK